MPEHYLNTLLPVIHKAIHAVLTRPQPHMLQNVSTNSFVYENIFQATRTTVLVAGKGQWIYDKLLFELKEAAVNITKHLISLNESKKMDLLNEFVDASTWFDGSVRLLETLLTYLDRVFVLQKPGMLCLNAMNGRQLAMQLFKAHVLQFGKISFDLVEAVKEWANWERRERAPHLQRPTVINLVGILNDYSLFGDYFLKTYVEATRSFYTDESERLAVLLKEERGNFLVNCFERIEEERVRSREVLANFESDWSDVFKATEKSLLEGRLRWLSLGIVTTVDGKDTEGLKRMYDLFARVDGLKLLCDAFKVHVHNKVVSIVSDKAHDDEMVDRLLEFKGFIDAALPEAFSDAPTAGPGTAGTSARVANKQFIHAATDAFATGFRARRNTPAEMIAKYLDREMRRGQKDASDADFAAKLDAVLGLYSFTQDKDVFRTFYHRALAKRLLLQRSASDDFEKSVLKKLKDHYDPEFGMGNDMFRDLALSRDFLGEFHERDIGRGSAQNLSVMVLQRSSWPFTAKQKEEALLPSTMQADLSKYATFYKNKHQGRKLDFDHALGTASLRGRFAAGEKELSVSLHQALVLLLFNDEDEIGFLDIKTQTRMDTAELQRTLQSLACGKKKVLLKRPVGRDVADTDVFVFNKDFTDPRARVHINSIQAKETPEESIKMQSAIEGDRRAYLDAAIVRTMKARKTMSHQALITATVDAVKAHFKPDVSMIKARFEYLIGAEYMKRDEDEQNVYVYVA
ncbi:Cullin-domain-containing protein [Phellopilus nigrolimitatus]|nr:Cullin-domain-containing protein [Phellopilus nigrolimitatus]